MEDADKRNAVDGAAKEVPTSSSRRLSRRAGDIVEACGNGTRVAGGSAG